VNQGATPSSAGRLDSDRERSLLEIRSVDAGYRRNAVLRSVSVTVPAGSVVALLGPNGAGKTTLLRVASGILRPTSGQVLSGGVDVTKSAPHRRLRSGVCLIPEGRGVFRSLTVKDNLRLQAPPWLPVDDYVERAVTAFPILESRLGQITGSLSGGQQQMVALSRAWVCEPRVVLLDEVSMGLAPRVVDEIFEALQALAQRGTALLVVEQYVSRVLRIADHVYVLRQGAIHFDGPPDELAEDELLSGYLGADERPEREELGTVQDPVGQ